jgi:hypothetical protein
MSKVIRPSDRDKTAPRRVRFSNNSKQLISVSVVTFVKRDSG